MPLALAFLAVLGAVAIAAMRAQSPVVGAAAPASAWVPDFPVAEPAVDPAPAFSWAAPLAVVRDMGEAVFSAGQVVLDTVGAAVKHWTLPKAGLPYAETINAAEVQHSIPPGLLGRVLYQESRFRPEIIDGRLASPAGALGIAQFMPATAAELGIDPLNPDQAIPGAARYLRQLFDRFGDWNRALAAYNWGQGNVARKGMEAMPAETRRYVAEIAADVGLGA